MRNSMFNVFFVNISQLSIKATSPHEGILWARSIRNSRAQFMCVPCRDFWCHVRLAKKRTPPDTFLKNHEPNCVPETNLNYLQNMPIHYPSGKYKLSVSSFLEYCYTRHFVHDISCLSKGHSVQTCTKFY